MHENNLYNLMLQATQENKSLWRITKQYQQDAAADPELLALWSKLATEKEAQLQAIESQIRKHLA